MTCGCGNTAGIAQAVSEPGGDEHVHADGTRHRHPSAHGAHDHPARESAQVVSLEAQLRAKNDALARRNREWLAARGVVALNVMGAPGCGKTTLLERTIERMRASRDVFVIEGDQATQNDARRVRAAGARVVQVNTGTGCHLDAEMVMHSLEELAPPRHAFVVIENVGNLVCPALFDLGEAARIVVLSTPEGDDKALKYPHMFAAADLVVVSKTDLLPHLDFDVDRALEGARAVKPGVAAIALSSRSGEGLPAWFDWLDTLLSGHRP